MSIVSHGVSPVHLHDPLAKAEKLVSEVAKTRETNAKEVQAFKEHVTQVTQALQDAATNATKKQLERDQALRSQVFETQESLDTYGKRLLDAKNTLSTLSHQPGPSHAYPITTPRLFPTTSSVYAPPFSYMGAPPAHFPHPMHPMQAPQPQRPIQVILPSSLFPSKPALLPAYTEKLQVGEKTLNAELEPTPLRDPVFKTSSNRIGELNFTVKRFDALLGYAPNPDLLKAPFVKGKLGGHRDNRINELSQIAAKAKDAYEQKDADALNKIKKQAHSFNPLKVRLKSAAAYVPIPYVRGHFKPYQEHPEDYKTIRYYKEDILTYIQDALRELDTSKVESLESKKQRHYSDQLQSLKSKLESAAQDIIDDYERTRDKQIAERRLIGLEKAAQGQLSYLLDYVLGTMNRTPERERLQKEIESQKNLLPEVYDVKVALGLKPPLTKNPEHKVAAAKALMTGLPIGWVASTVGIPYGWGIGAGVAAIAYGSRVSKAGAEMIRRAREMDIDGVARNLVELLTGEEAQKLETVENEIKTHIEEKTAEDETKELQAKFKSPANWKKTAGARKELAKSLLNSKAFHLKGAGQNEIDSLIKILNAKEPPKGVNVIERIDRTTRKLFKDSQQTPLWKALEEDSRKLLTDYVESGFSDEAETAINERINKFSKEDRQAANSAVNFENEGSIKKLLYTDLHGNTPLTAAESVPSDLKALTAYKKSLVELGNQYVMLNEDLQNNV